MPTSSAATAEAPSSTKRTNSSALFSTATFNRSCSAAFSPTNKRAPFVWTPPLSLKHCGKFMTPARWRTNWKKVGAINLIARLPDCATGSLRSEPGTCTTSGEYARELSLLLPQRGTDFCARRRCKFELTGWNGSVVGVLVGCDDTVAVCLKHVRALGKEIVTQMQQQFLKNAFHRRISRSQFEVVTFFRFLAADVKGVLDVFQIEGGGDR